MCVNKPSYSATIAPVILKSKVYMLMSDPVVIGFTT